LAVPGSQTHFHAKADRSDADQIFLDLEDSVAPAVKGEARLQVVDALRNFEFAGKVRTVRVNACDTEWCYEDIITVVQGVGDRIDCLVIPKVEDVDQVHFVDHLLSQIERKLGMTRRIGLELQIESARGLENINAIAAASNRTETLIFGPADFSASLRVPELTLGRLKPEYPGDYWHYFLARIVVAARANGLQPIDGPYAQVRDFEGLRTFAERAAMLGFDGKWALNPAQVGVLNQVFTPRQEDFNKAVAILDAYRRATDVEKTGAVMLGEEMIDEATRKMAAVMVERGEAFGMNVRAP
jgi:citrate lyase subunit beta/citryl-CoA lyase